MSTAQHYSQNEGGGGDGDEDGEIRDKLRASYLYVCPIVGGAMNRSPPASLSFSSLLCHFSS